MGGGGVVHFCNVDRFGKKRLKFEGMDEIEQNKELVIGKF